MMPDKPISGRAVLVAMLMFFGVIFAVNGTFLYFALSSFPGTSTEGAYKKGLAFNQILAEVERQNALGWRSSVAATADGDVSLTLAGPSGEGLSRLQVEAVLMRPLDNDQDQHIKFIETTGGTYRTQVAPLAAGQWRLEISARRDGERVYFKIHNLVIRP